MEKSRKNIIQRTAMILLGMTVSVGLAQEVSAATPQFELIRENTHTTINLDQVVNALDGNSSRGEDEKGQYIEYTVKDQVLRFYFADKNIAYVNGLQESFEISQLDDGTVLPNESKGTNISSSQEFEVPVEFAERLLDLQVSEKVATLSDADNEQLELAQKKEEAEKAIQREEAKKQAEEDRILEQKRAVEAKKQKAEKEAEDLRQSLEDAQLALAEQEKEVEKSRESLESMREETDKNPQEQEEPKKDKIEEEPIPVKTVTVEVIESIVKETKQSVHISYDETNNSIKVESLHSENDSLSLEDYELQRESFIQKLAKKGFYYNDYVYDAGWTIQIPTQQ